MKQNSQSIEDGFFVVEKIISRKVVNGKIFYLLKWKGYGSKYNSWQSEDELNDPSYFETAWTESLKRKRKLRRETRGREDISSNNLMALERDVAEPEDATVSPREASNWLLQSFVLMILMIGLMALLYLFLWNSAGHPF